MLMAVDSGEEIDSSVICWLRSVGLKKMYY